MRRLLVILPLVVAAGLFALFASQIGRDPAYVPPVLVGKPAPDFTLAAVAGLDQPGVATQDLMGRVSIVNVFASWCDPCRDEHPLLMQLAARDDIQMVGLNHNDPPENARAFLAELGNPYDRIGSDRDRRVSLDWGVYGVPETFIVDRSGTITYKFTGPLSERGLVEDLLPAIEDALAN